MSRLSDERTKGQADEQTFRRADETTKTTNGPNKRTKGLGVCGCVGVWGTSIVREEVLI